MNSYVYKPQKSNVGFLKAVSRMNDTRAIHRFAEIGVIRLRENES